MKRAISLLLTIILTICFCMTGCSAAENKQKINADDFILTMQIGNPTMTVNGNEQEIDVGRGTVPIIQNERTLVPIRAIIEAMGGTVTWDGETQTALLELNGDIITLTIGSTTAYFNETASTLDVAPQVINERTMLPIRYIAESFKFDVNWDGDTQTITITKYTNKTEQKTGKTLVVYFSMPETDNPNNMTTEEDNSVVVIDGKVLGNTQYMAFVIQETLKADIFRIEPKTPYPTDHKTLVDLAADEQENNARPELLSKIENLDKYDTIYIGYPNWWGDLPMIMYSFFEQHDFSGKTIIPFNTHGGSGFSDTINTIKNLEKDADVLDGLSISRNHIQDAESEIIEWVNSIKK